MTRLQPTYPLADIQRLVTRGDWLITRSAAEGARSLGLGADEIRDCILDLQAESFYKTMASDKRPGTFQDVYRTRYETRRIYIKLQLAPDGRAITISFKIDESYE